MRKFQPDEDYSTKNSYRFDERCMYIVKCDEDFSYTEAYLSPEFLREYSLTQGFEIEPLKSRDGTQAFLLEQWGYYYLLLAYEREAVFMMMVEDLDDTDRILNIASRSYLAFKNLHHHPPGYQLLLDFDKVDIWGDETEEHWHFRPCVGGYVVDGPSGDGNSSFGERFTERSFELTKMLFQRYVGWCKK